MERAADAEIVSSLPLGRTLQNGFQPFQVFQLDGARMKRRTHKKASQTQGIACTRVELGELFHVSSRTIGTYVASGKIAKAGPGRFFLQSAVDYLIQLRVADNVVAGAKRNEKLEAEIEKLRLDAEARRLEIDKMHAERLLSLTDTEEKALDLHARLLESFATHAARSLAEEVGALLSAVPAFKAWTNQELAELSCAWAEAWVREQGTYLLGPDGSFQDSEAWRAAQLPATAQEKPFNPEDGEPFYSGGDPDGVHGESENTGWWRMVPNPDKSPLALRWKFIKLENYAAPPPRSILRALMAKGRGWKKHDTEEKGHADEQAR